MHDKRMDLLTLLSPGREHAAPIDLLATDLDVARPDIERLVAQLRALGFRIVHEQGRVWVDWSGWPEARRAAEQHLAHHSD